jgi:phosphoadenosine phosphosulfate reductase
MESAAAISHPAPAVSPAVHVTMVKKRLISGEPCRKCAQAETMLRARGLWDRIDEVVWAVEGDPESAGERLGAECGVASAPFFVVRDGSSAPRVYQSTIEFLRDRFAAATPRKRPAIDPHGIDGLSRDYEGRDPAAVLRWGLERFGRQCAIAFSGAEDVALVDMAARSGFEFNVFALDTGRLHPETYRFLEEVRTHYGIEIDLVSPDPVQLGPFVRTKGLFSFYEDGHHECCAIRKVEPLRRTLAGHRAWVTGQRRDQNPATRSELRVIQIDGAFAGFGGEPLLKLNPLAGWSSARTWQYIREHGVPHNPLHDRGYLSIGCEPCTRPIQPGQHERDGRWWWENAADKECGLHSVPPPAPR